MKLHQRLAALPVDAWPGRRIAWIGGCFIAAIVLLAGYDMWRGYQATVEETQRELYIQSRVIAEQTARSVQAVDVMLRHVAAEYRRGRLSRLGPEELHVYLRDITVGLKQIDGLGMFDAAGEQIAVSWPAPRKAVNMSKLPRFQQLRDDAKLDFVIFEAAPAAGDGVAIVPFGRRLETADGQFAGVIAARGRVDYFEQFYRDAYPEPSTRVALLHRNATLLARHPPSAAALGQRFPVLEGLLPEPGGRPVASRGISPVDGVDRFAAIRLVPDYPLVVVVTREASVALAPWRSQAVGTAWRTLALGTLASLLIAMVWRQLARVSAAHASLEVSEQRYALAAAGSDTGVWDWDLVARSAYESRRARQLQGLPLEPETQPLEALQGLLTYHPDDAPLREGAMQAHLDGKTPHYEVEYRVRRSDGQYRWIHVRALCTRAADGTPLRIAGSVTDIDDRKRAESALRQSEERYALAMTGSNEGHWLWEIPAQQVYVSDKLAELFGIAGGAQVLADSDYFARLPLHPDDRERVHRNRNDHVAGLTPRLDHEFRIVDAASGEVRWMHTRAQCFRDAGGMPLRMAGSTVDATQRKRAEQALRESEQRFADAVAGSDDGIWEWDYVKGQSFGSQRGREILGLLPGPEVMPLAAWYAEMKGQLHPDDVARRDAAIEAHMSGRADAYEGDFRVRQRDGSYRWVHIHGRCVRDAEGRPLRMAGSASDIDARKRAEEAQRRSEERYARAMEGSNEAHWDWNLETGEQYLSPRVIEMYGLAPGEYMTREQFLAAFTIHPEDRPHWQQTLQDHLAGRTPRLEVEYRVALKSGELRWLHVRGQCFRDANDKAMHLTGSTSDVTERKRAQAQRERLEQQLRQAQKLEAIGTLAGGIAHDFNNILSAILGYGELAQKGAPEGSAQRRHLDAALAAGQRAKSLVERILAFSRSGMGERVPVHVQSVVDEALDGIAATLPAGVTLERRLAAGDSGVLGDATQIHQVVMNLCANAVQAMKSEGRLVVTLDTLRLAAPLAVTTSTLPAGDVLRLAVADSGGGIEPRLLERIFDPFFTTKEVGVGTGLGLSLVHGIVTDLGGGIDVRSASGEGSTFTIFLPAHGVVRAPASDAATADDAPRGDGQTVLLVDDEEPLVRLGEELLAGLGYEPVGFVSSAAALDALRAEPARFDAVLSDESMPALTGRELAAEARRLRPGLPVVLMSGFVSPALLQQAREIGVADVLSKPLAGREIARALAAALRSRAA